MSLDASFLRALDKACQQANRGEGNGAVMTTASFNITVHQDSLFVNVELYGKDQSLRDKIVEACAARSNTGSVGEQTNPSKWVQTLLSFRPLARY